MRITTADQLGLVFAALALATACANATEGIRVSDAWVRASPMMARAIAAYMVISNTGAADDRLISVRSDFASSVELHKSEERDGMMEMLPLPAIVVPAHGQAVLQPGGMHIMLMGLNRVLQAGEQVTLTLNFEKVGAVSVSAAVRDQ
jgi:copper(I)-binding protein